MPLPLPTPIFDTKDTLDSTLVPSTFQEHSWTGKDLSFAKEFLNQYVHKESTFRAYRREIERLLQWSWSIHEKSVLTLERADFEQYIEFCMNPPVSWIGTKTVSRFTNHEGGRIRNKSWRPFVMSIPKREFKKGVKPDRKNYRASEKSIREIFIICGSFYSMLTNEGTISLNPILLIRQKSKYYTRVQGETKVDRILTARQWQYSITVTQELAQSNPAKHERSLFILSSLYLMYLRISELVASEDWQPSMSDFSQDASGSWFFKVLGKGNKLRTVSVSDGMLTALKRYREHLNLTPLPSPTERMPLIGKLKGKGPIKSDREIRSIVQFCFDSAGVKLRAEGHEIDADLLETATVHWLRHTGISDDLNKRGRPMIHVRDDAGHEKSTTTDRYNNSDIKERYMSAKTKTVKPSEE